MHRDIAAIVLVDANLQACLERQAEENSRRGEGAVDRSGRDPMVDELERAPAFQSRLEVARDRFVGAGVSAGDRGEADDGNLRAHVGIFHALRAGSAAKLETTIADA